MTRGIGGKVEWGKRLSSGRIWQERKFLCILSRRRLTLLFQICIEGISVTLTVPHTSSWNCWDYQKTQPTAIMTKSRELCLPFGCGPCLPSCMCPCHSPYPCSCCGALATFRSPKNLPMQQIAAQAQGPCRSEATIRTRTDYLTSFGHEEILTWSWRLKAYTFRGVLVFLWKNSRRLS